MLNEMAALALLAETFPTRQSLYTEIINLRAILNLPRGTEHFISDVHGEYETFCHILNNCSGVIREKAERLMGDELPSEELNNLLTLIYYPVEKLARLKTKPSDKDEWYADTISRLIRLSRNLSSKYTRSKVRKAMPPDYAYILDELLHAQPDEDNNQFVYHQKILQTMIQLGSGDEFIIALCKLIKRLAVDKLHIVGDIYDRGPHAEKVMDLLMQHHAVDFEWGNHDILWMGAACGNTACIAATVRNCVKYNNLSVLESGYGISLRSLMLFSQETYPSLILEKAVVHAITVIMFKLEGQLIKRNPDFRMEDRLLLHTISQDTYTQRLDGEDCRVHRLPLPTLNPENAYELTEAEEKVINELCHQFRHSDRLQRHIDFLYQHGRLYRIADGNLLFHGCVPMTEEGGFARVVFRGKSYAGRSLMQFSDDMARLAREQHSPEAIDFMWYLWCAELSPVCGRRMKTFERVFIADEHARSEPSNPYYRYCETERGCEKILREFGLTSPENRIINGHTPIRVKDGESPIKANGKLIVIDGGFCRSYQKQTGIAG
ncbi:MAG: fructose-1,6-bisphosphatase, partial [Bacillota bacterium]